MRSEDGTNLLVILSMDNETFVDVFVTEQNTFQYAYM
jgi:hypothetical protein